MPEDPGNLARQELDQAIVELYRLFAHRRRGSRPWADIGFPPEKLDLPEQGDVRTLGATEYAHLAWHAFCFDGDHPPTVKYFLPRLFGEWEWAPFEHEMVVDRMLDCDWRHWPDAEVQAIEQFCLARFRWCLQQPYEHGDGHAVTEMLELAAFMGMEVQPFFPIWRSDASMTATLHLARFIQEAFADAWSVERIFITWRELWSSRGVSEATINQVLDELRRPWIRNRLSAAFFAVSAIPDQQLLSNSHAYLELWEGLIEGGSAPSA